MAAWTIGDLTPPLEATLSDRNGAYSLAGATSVTLRYRLSTADPSVEASWTELAM